MERKMMKYWKIVLKIHFFVKSLWRSIPRDSDQDTWQTFFKWVVIYQMTSGKAQALTNFSLNGGYKFSITLNVFSFYITFLLVCFLFDPISRITWPRKPLSSRKSHGNETVVFRITWLRRAVSSGISRDKDTVVFRIRFPFLPTFA